MIKFHSLEQYLLTLKIWAKLVQNSLKIKASLFLAEESVS
jgi:hypothetical protein